MMRLNGKSAIITGGAGGIGSATARLFCEEGARVLLVDHDEEAAINVASTISADLPDADIRHLSLDLAREAAAAQVVTAAVEAFGSVDILVNNAGIRSYERLAEAKSETWRKIIDVNLLSCAYLAREVLPELRRSGSGSIVNISSTHGVHPRSGMGQYDATKAALISLTRTMAAEEAEHGVRVNAVCPGPTLTAFHVRRAQAEGRPESELRKEKRKDCWLSRWAHPREIAYPILWLSSDEASFVTATAIMVDGGIPVI